MRSFFTNPRHPSVRSTGPSPLTITLMTAAALACELSVIMCVGELADHYDAGTSDQVVSAQVKAGLANCSADDSARLVIAYEPVWAIGTGKTATAQDAQEVCHALRARLIAYAERPVCSDIHRRAVAADVRDRKIVSKNGHQIRFLDATPSGGSKGALIIEDAHGNRITMSNGHIHLKSTSVLTLEGGTITLNGRVVAPNGNPI